MRVHGVVSGSSTPDSSTIYALQLLIASHKQFRGVLGAEPPVVAFSLGFLGLVSQEYDVLVFSVQTNRESTKRQSTNWV